MQQVEAGAAVALPLHQLEAVDLPLGLTAAPGLGQGGPDRMTVYLQPGGKRVDGTREATRAASLSCSTQRTVTASVGDKVSTGRTSSHASCLGEGSAGPAVGVMSGPLGAGAGSYLRAVRGALSG